MHRYLFVEIDGNKVVKKHIFRTRAAGIRQIEKRLNSTSIEVEEVVYHDARKHQQEFICNQGLRFLIYRI